MYGFVSSMSRHPVVDLHVQITKYITSFLVHIPLVLQDQQHGGVGCTHHHFMCAELPKPHPWSPLLPPIQLAAPCSVLTALSVDPLWSRHHQDARFRTGLRFLV